MRLIVFFIKLRVIETEGLGLKRPLGTEFLKHRALTISQTAITEHRHSNITAHIHHFKEKYIFQGIVFSVARVYAYLVLFVFLCMSTVLIYFKA